MNKKLEIVARIEPDGGMRKVVGRDAWALMHLVSAGRRGCTPPRLKEEKGKEPKIKGNGASAS